MDTLNEHINYIRCKIFNLQVIICSQIINRLYERKYIFNYIRYKIPNSIKLYLLKQKFKQIDVLIIIKIIVYKS